MGGAWTPAVSINCSMQDCAFNGLIMSGIDTSESHAPAVRVYEGRVNPATITSNTMMGGQDIVDADGKPAGGFVTRSVGGFTIAAPHTCPTGAHCDPPPANGTGVPLSGAADFALLVGSTGVQSDGSEGGNASWGLDHQGATHHWGPGGSAHTTLLRHTKGSAVWDPPALSAAGWGVSMAKIAVDVEGAEVGDMCAAALTSMAGLGQVTCHVVQSSVVDVVLSAGEELDVSVGVARVVVSKFVFGEDVH